MEDMGTLHLAFFQLYNAKPSSSWECNEELQTLEDPMHLVQDICRAKFMEVLHSTFAYDINVNITSWVVDNGVLRLQVTYHSKNKYTTKYLLQQRGTLDVAKRIEKDLQNLFHCEVFVFVVVDIKHPNVKEHSKKHQSTPHNLN